MRYLILKRLKRSLRVVRKLIKNSEIPYIVKVQDFTGSRAANTNYTNNTGKTLIVNITCQFNTTAAPSFARFWSEIDGVVNGISGVEDIQGKFYMPLTFLVPPQSVYKIGFGVSAGSFLNIHKWIEAY